MTFGYNGFGRLNGHEVGARRRAAGHLRAAGAWPDGPGFGRLFQEAQIGQIAWLLPAATVFLWRCWYGGGAHRAAMPSGRRCGVGVVADRRPPGC